MWCYYSAVRVSKSRTSSVLWLPLWFIWTLSVILSSNGLKWENKDAGQILQWSNHKTLLVFRTNIALCYQICLCQLNSKHSYVHDPLIPALFIVFICLVTSPPTLTVIYCRSFAPPSDRTHGSVTRDGVPKAAGILDFGCLGHNNQHGVKVMVRSHTG